MRRLTALLVAGIAALAACGTGGPTEDDVDLCVTVMILDVAVNSGDMPAGEARQVLDQIMASDADDDELVDALADLRAAFRRGDEYSASDATWELAQRCDELTSPPDD